MARKKSQRTVHTDDKSVLEWWWRFQPQIVHQLPVKDGLAQRRYELEAIVEPHVTTRKTHDAVLFKGKRRYVKAKFGESDRDERLVWAAIFALQCIYNLEGAISTSDLDEVIRWTYGFARCDFDVVTIQRCEWDAGAAIALWDLDKRRASSRHQKHVAAGTLKKKFKSDDDRRSLQEAHAKYRHQRDWLQATTNELREQGCFPTLSKAAVKKELMRMGIVH